MHTCIAFTVLQVIVRPLQSMRGKPKIWHKVATAWLLALVVATPQLFIFVQAERGLTADGHPKHVCVSDGYQPGQTWQRKTYFTFLTSYILVIPTLIMTFCYANIIRVVFMRAGERVMQPKLRFTSSRRHSDNASRHYSLDSQATTDCTRNAGSLKTDSLNKRTGVSYQAANNIRIPTKLISSSKRNVVKMTLSVIIAFIVCWSPYFIVGLIRIYSDYTIRLDDIYSLAELTAMLHSALNPILYGAFSTSSAIKTLKSSCCFRKRRRRQREAERIVVNISVGSDFDSLVFVTHPEVYTRRLSLLDSQQEKEKACSSHCLCLLPRLCHSLTSTNSPVSPADKHARDVINDKPYSSESQTVAAGTRQTSAGTSSIRSVTSNSNTRTTTITSGNEVTHGGGEGHVEGHGGQDVRVRGVRSLVKGQRSCDNIEEAYSKES